jgi:stage II sporulation protein D
VILAALLVFRLAGETVSPGAEAAAPRPVGSLQKPWVVAAWAEAHPNEEPPRLDCTEESLCWKPSGHGRVDLSRALAHSCNAYFLALARTTPEEVRARTLSDAGFQLTRPLSPEATIGLGPLDTLPRVSPARLLHAYRDILTRPWPSREDLRLALVDGMRAAALDGTGAALARRGHFVKTGTVPSLDGRPLATSGWALAASAGGESLVLALLPDGTGSEAAAALGAALAGERRADATPGRRTSPGDLTVAALVRVRLLEALRPANVNVSNAGDAPVRSHRSRTGDAWLGPGASVAAEPGLTIGPGLLRLAVEPYGLVRFVEGTLETSGSPDSLFLVLSSTRRAWVDGVLRGELRDGSSEIREELAATALRFLRTGPRHGRDDFCDSTHCAVFAGRGPLATWVTPRRAETPASGKRTPAPPLLDDAAWHRVLSLAECTGPAQFTAHCGGAALSSYEVWGRGPRDATLCPRHGPADDKTWERVLPSAALHSAFGETVIDLRALIVSDVRKTRVTTKGRTVDLLYDDLHRILAPSLGWEALPSPPDAFQRTPGGFLARGRGRGHRVGLCLAAPAR